jgi:uncharacterized membrane protein (UPF0127 family)
MYRWIKTAVIALAVVIGGTVLWWQMEQGSSLLRLHGHNYQVTVMRSEAELEKGLSGTNSLPSGQAMVFVFGSDSKWPMWMKDMKYPIDMVWLNGDKQVVYTVKNASPSSYKSDTDATKFTPGTDARYVIELPSGTIEQTGIIQGDSAGLPSGI